MSQLVIRSFPKQRPTEAQTFQGGYEYVNDDGKWTAEVIGVADTAEAGYALARDDYNRLGTTEANTRLPGPKESVRYVFIDVTEAYAVAVGLEEVPA